MTIFPLIYLAFIFLCGYGGYWIGSWFGTLGAVIGTILGGVTGYLIMVHHLIVEHLADWWEGDAPAKGQLKPRHRYQERLITVEQAEADYFVSVGKLEDEGDPDRRAQLAKPFGHSNQEWEKLKGLMQDGDELWELCTPKDFWFFGWHSLSAGHAILLIRQGKKIGEISLVMS